MMEPCEAWATSTDGSGCNALKATSASGRIIPVASSVKAF